MRPLSIVVHGESGTGKSWFADTAPAPRLILDAEGGSRFTPSTPKVYWDPMTGPPPRNQETVIVMVRDFPMLTRVFDWLNTGDHDFQSVCMDSVTEIQKRCIDNVTGTEQMRIQDWGTVLREMEILVRRFRDLWMHTLNPIPVTVFITTTKIDDKGVFRPHVQGQLALSLPYFVDIVGYLYTQSDPEAGGLKRHLLTEAAPGFIAKDRTDRLGYEIVDPSIANMLDTVFGPAQPDAAVAATEGGQ